MDEKRGSNGYGTTGVSLALYKNPRSPFSLHKPNPLSNQINHQRCYGSCFFLSPLSLSQHLHFLSSQVRAGVVKSEKNMVKLSNSVVGILNFVTFLLSVPILGAGIWLCTKASTDCEKFLQKPLVVLGVFLLLISLAGLIGACCRVSWLLWVYLLVMFLLIVLLFCFTIFAFVVSNKGKGVVGQVVSGRGYKEYRLGDYSNWLQKSTIDNWGKYRSCLIDGKVCKTLSLDRDANNGFDKFIKKNLNPIQSGCCTPPAECAFTYQNATVWNKPANAINSTNPDCTSWNNQDLCFNCQSCKAGVIANTKSNWKKVATFNIIFLVFLIIVYSIGCCAFRNNRHYNSFPGWKGGHA